MKILHLCFSGGWGGLEKYSVSLAEGLKSRGHDVHYACRKGTKIERELAFPGIPHTSFGYVKYIDLPLMFRLRKLIASKGFEIAHAHMSQDLGVIVPALWGLGNVKLFFSLHMIVPQPKKDFYHRLQYKRVKKIFALGAEGEKSARENLPIKSGQAMELPYGLDVENYSPVRSSALREKLGFNKETKLVGVLSRLEPLKGQMETVRAMPKVLARYAGAHLLIVGDETEHLKGKVKPQLEAEIEKLGISDKVTFLGYQKNVQEVMNALDVFLLPSHFESYSICVIEAKLCGVPVVAASSGGVPQNLGWGKYGILVEPKNPESLAGGILEVLDNPDKAGRRAEEARKAALERYDKKRILEVVEKEYRS